MKNDRVMVDHLPNELSCDYRQEIYSVTEI